jgi:radical SAM protein with 4Fe4S-binding SPASM domain
MIIKRPGRNSFIITVLHKLIAKYYLKKPEVEFLLNQKYYSWRAVFYEVMNTIYYLAKSEKSYKVTSVAFESSNTCNIKCLQCPVNRTMKREKGYLDLKLFKKVIDDNPQLLFVMPYLWGEPLLHPKIYEMIEYSVKHNVPVYISTNATLLADAGKIDELLTSGISALQISLDGIGDTYTRTRGVEYQEIKKTIELVLERRRALNIQRDVALTLNVVIFEETEKVAEQVKEEWENKVDYVQFSPKIELTPTDRKHPCFELWRGNMVILWDGRCVPCCVDYEGEVVYGDANKEKLQDIWNGKTLRNLRKEHVARKHNGLCKRCNEYTTSLANKRFQ